MANEVVNISLQADISQLRAELAKMPGISGAEAGKMVKALQGEYNKAVKAAKDAAKNSKKEWDKHLNEIGGAGKQVASMLGGSFGAVGNVVFELGGKLGGIAGPAGLATAGIAALVVGTVGMATAIDSFIDSADPAIARLKEIHGSKPIPPETIAALDDYRQVSLGAEAASARLKVQVAGLAADAFEPAMASATGLLMRIDSLAESGGVVSDVLHTATTNIRGLVGVMTGGGSELLRFTLGLDSVIGSLTGFKTLADEGREGVEGFVDATKKGTEALSAHEQALKDRAAVQTELEADLQFEKQAMIDLGLVYDDSKEIAEEAAKKKEGLAAASAAHAKKLAEEKQAQSEQMAEYQDAINKDIAWVAARKAAHTSLADTAQETAADTVTAEEQVILEFAKRIIAINAAAEATGELGAAEKARTDADARAVRDLAALRIEREKTVADAKQAFDEADAKRKDDIAAKQMETLRHVADGFGFVEDGLSSAADVAQTMADTMVEGAQDGTEAEKKRALAAFRTAKALALAAAAIEAIRAGISLIPSYAYLGPGAPAAAAVTAGTAFAVAAAKIASTKPPSFQRGGMVLGGPSGATPDHVQGDVQPGEFIATKQDVQRNGGPRGVEQALRGGRQQPVHVHLSLSGRQIAEALWDPLGSLTGGPPLGRRPAMG